MAARLQDGEGAQMEASPARSPGHLDRLDAGQDGLRHRPHPSPARCPCSGPRRASHRRRRPAAPTCACALPLAQRRSASTRRTPDRASQTPATPPSAPKTKRRKPGAVAAALAAAATPQAHIATSEAAPDRRAASPRMQPYPTVPSTHLAAVRLLARLTHAYRPWAGNKHPRLGTRVPATPGLVSTQLIAGVGRGHLAWEQ